MEPYFIGNNAKKAVYKDNPDAKFCNLIATVAFFILTIVVIFQRRDVNENYWIQEMVDKQLTLPLGIFDQEVQFDKIDSFNTFRDFLTYQIGASVYYNGSEEKNDSPMFRNSVPIGKLRMRQIRSKKKKCSLDFDKRNCYHEVFEKEETSNLEGSSRTDCGWQCYRTADQTGVVGIFYGLNTFYDGGGYV